MKKKGPSSKCHLPRVALTLAFTWAIVYVVCLIWGSMQKSSGMRKLYEQMMAVSYPGFSMSFGGMVIGLVEAFIYGYVIGAIFCWIYNGLKMR